MAKKYSHRHVFEYEGRRYDIKADSEKELWEKVTNKKRDLEEGKIVSSNMLLTNWIDMWLETYKKDSVGTSWYTYLEAIAEKLRNDCGPLPIKAIKPIQLQKFINGFASYSDSYLSKIYNVIREVFSAAVANDLIPKSPAQNLQKPVGKPKQMRRSITEEERKIILKVAQYHRGGLFVKIMLYCGLRPGEVMALQWSDMDLDNGILHVTKAVKRDGLTGYPKTHAGVRDLPIPAFFIAELRNCAKSKKSFVCTQTDGFTRLTETSTKLLWKNFKRYMHKEMGGKFFNNAIVDNKVADDLVLYCLRHTYCTDLEKKGVPINIAKVLMGHSSIEVTSKIYTHFDDNTLEVARTILDKSTQ